MTVEDKIRDLEKRIKTPDSLGKLTKKPAGKPNISKLKELAKEIRKTVEDYPDEPTIQPHSSSRP